MLVDRLIFELLTLDQGGISRTDPLLGYSSKYQECLLVFDGLGHFAKFSFGHEI